MHAQQQAPASLPGATGAHYKDRAAKPQGNPTGAPFEHVSGDVGPASRGQLKRRPNSYNEF